MNRKRKVSSENQHITSFFNSERAGKVKDDLAMTSTMNGNTLMESGRKDEDFRGQHIFKVVVVGDINVGKTCLTVRYCCGLFQSMQTTIGFDYFEKIFAIGAQAVRLQIWDTAGQERFRRSLVRQYYRDAVAVVFVYDVTKLSSFEKLPELIDECKIHYSSPIVRVLVGNKNDMVREKCVQTSRAQKFAEFHEMTFYETSARDSSQAPIIEQIFTSLAEKLLENTTIINAKKLMKRQLTDNLLVINKTVEDSEAISNAMSATSSRTCGC